MRETESTMKSAEPNYTKENSLASETDFFLLLFLV